jgi:hypothetical protein
MVEASILLSIISVTGLIGTITSVMVQGVKGWWGENMPKSAKIVSAGVISAVWVMLLAFVPKNALSNNFQLLQANVQFWFWLPFWLISFAFSSGIYKQVREAVEFWKGHITNNSKA